MNIYHTPLVTYAAETYRMAKMKQNKIQVGNEDSDSSYW